MIALESHPNRLQPVFEHLIDYAKANIPVLLEGPTGSSKSALLKVFCQSQGQATPLILNAGEQSEPKSLIGSYTVNQDHPGSFKWTKGILADAIERGTWTIIDDFHLANPEYCALLRPLLEGTTSTLPTGQGAPLSIHPHFRLFATSQSSHGPSMGVARLFAKIDLPPIDMSEASLILSTCYPSLQKVVPLILTLYQHCAAMEDCKWNVSIRNLLKIFSRLQCLLGEIKEDGLSVEVRQVLLLEVADCFFGHLPVTLRYSHVLTLAPFLCLPNEEVATLVESRKPALHFAESGGLVTCGRVRLPTKLTITPRLEFAPTKLSLQILEKLAICVHQQEAVLLVGETGTGKTTMVQHLASILGHGQLIVLNLSQQSEASDLLGGYRPATLSVSAKLLVEQFEGLFAATFSRSKNTQYITEVIHAFSHRQWERLIRLFLQVINLVKEKQKYSEAWEQFEVALSRMVAQWKAGPEAPFFAFIEGALVRAMENGHWILLDEVNLATSETLEILSGLLQDSSASLMLGEGNRQVKRHPAFRLFACMNPATDVSKRNLPLSIRTKFTEIYVDETDIFRDDLRLIINHGLEGGVGFTPIIRESLLDIYYGWKDAVGSHAMVDGSRKRPLLNLRTLTRAIRFARQTEVLYGASGALYEGLSMTFLTMLDAISADLAEQRLRRMLPPSTVSLNGGLLAAKFTTKASIIVGKYIVPQGPETPQSEEQLASRFVLTPSVKGNVAHVARAIMAGQCPILIEGPTSAGKTSVVEFLASLTGHRFVRINNHEHTDIQEYIGAYQPNEVGQLVFREGLLLEALRKGYWIVLDELNLAPSDVLEALNRLLDDNRELYVPELGEVVRPHPSFMLFATQNPAGVYGGRKVLSKAFRSRFIELQFGDLHIGEVETIIARRCQIAPSHAKKVASVYCELQQRRTGTNVFAGRHSLVTLRDMFRWASRPMVTIEDLALNGYAVLAERLRHADERLFIRECLERNLKIKIDPETQLYQSYSDDSAVHITWTRPMKRLYSLVQRAVANKEPVLLVGETGCGKTTVCQVLSQLMNLPLTILNCHQNTETADFIGCLRPNRQSTSEVADSNAPLFKWQDGPLIDCMRHGKLFLVDEISLADDSVLERLNSVLESGRSLTLAEAIHGEHIVAHPSFAFLATMNPGGDFGKKELSPALRNRFTEIWVPSIGDADDLTLILSQSIEMSLAKRMVDFVDWWKSRLEMVPALRRWPFSIRDILSWQRFLTILGSDPWNVVNAAAALFLDPAKSVAQSDSTSVTSGIAQFLSDCNAKLESLFGAQVATPTLASFVSDDHLFGLRPFTIPVSKHQRESSASASFAFDSPTTLSSLWRILRSMRFGKSILLEGSPGVGKTSIISAIAEATGNHLVRINLSEQTDLIDLFGGDMPTESESSSSSAFSWVDGPLLRALKRGDWILLDELNLASQSVLEGLNACLDHRGAVYIPELDRTFDVNAGTRIFAAQNPLKQGGGRKGLPKSFLNRFVSVWIDPLTPTDMVTILTKKAPSLQATVVKAVECNQLLSQMIVDERQFGLRGAPWEFNLRDLSRWIELRLAHPTVSPGHHFALLYASRMRSPQDRQTMIKVIESVFGDVSLDVSPEYMIEDGVFCLGDFRIPLDQCLAVDLDILPSQLRVMEALLACIEQRWLGILVGAAGIGRTSLVRLLAAMHGRPLRQLTLNPETDTAELLGTFIQSSSGSSDNLSFVWQDGPLVEALVKGAWIVLDNANHCNPSVLDRLNSLFEPNGMLMLSECSSSGGPRIIRPHPDFRIFMTTTTGGAVGVGELSRAMRNRGVEIAMLSNNQCAVDLVERMSIVQAGSASVTLSSRLVSTIATRYSAPHQLHQQGKLASIVPYKCDDVSHEGILEQGKFWMEIPVKLFGRERQLFMQAILHQFLTNIKCSHDAVALLKALLSMSCMAVTIVDKHGNVIDGNAKIRHTMALTTLPSLDKDWKRLWKTQLAPFRSDPTHLQQLQSFVNFIISLPSTQSIKSKVSILLDSFTRLSSPISLEALSLQDCFIEDSHGLVSALSDEMCAFLKRLALLASGNQSDSKIVKALLLNGGASMPITWNASSILANALLALRRHQRQGSISELMMEENAVETFLSNAMDMMDADQSVSKAILALTNDQASSDLCAVGVGQFKTLLQLLEVNGDPLEAHYLPKRDLLNRLVSLNQEVTTLQTTLRVRLYGDVTIPGALQTIITHQQQKLESLKQLLGVVDLAYRKEIMAKVRQFVSIINRIDQHVDVDVGMAVKNVTVLKERLLSVANHNEDLVWSFINALDLIVIGLCVREASSTRISAPSSQVLLFNEMISQQDCIIEELRGNSSLHLVELYLGYHQLQVALMPDSLSISKDHLSVILNVLHQHKSLLDKEDAESSLYSFSGLDEEAREGRIQEQLFSPTIKSDKERLGDMLMQLMHIGNAKRDLDSGMTAVAALASDASPRTLIEAAYRQLKSHASFKNIYRDPHPDEALSALTVMRELMTRVKSLLEEYPENDLLQAIMAQCDRFMGLSSSTPLIALLTSLEQLLQKCQSWQTLADRTHSIQSQMDNLTEVIIRWRKLELHGWRRILDACEEDYHRRVITDQSIWVSRVLATTYDQGDKLMGLLDTFLLSGPLGEFAGRMQLLQHCATLPTTNASSGKLALQLCRYYQGLATTLRDNVSEHRRQVGTDLKATLITIVWSDKTYWAVHQTVEKSHRLISKQVRKHRELLDQPVSLYLTRIKLPQVQMASLSHIDKMAIPDFSGSKLKLMVGGVPKVAAGRLQVALHHHDSVALPMGLATFADDILQQISELSTMSGKDGYQLKQKAFVDMLKALKAFGLRLAAPVKAEESSVLSLLAVAGASHNLVFDRYHSEEYLNRSLAQWHELSNPSIKVHEDLGVRQVEAARNAVFRLLEISLKQRLTYHTLLQSIDAIQDASNNIVKHHQRMDDDEMLSIDREAARCCMSARDRALLICKHALKLLEPHHTSHHQPLTRKISLLESIKLSDFANASGSLWIGKRNIDDYGTIVDELTENSLGDGDERVRDVMEYVMSGIDFFVSTWHSRSLISTDCRNSVTLDENLIVKMQLFIQRLEGTLEGSKAAQMTETSDYGLPMNYLTLSVNLFSQLQPILCEYHALLQVLSQRLLLADEEVSLVKIISAFMHSIEERLLWIHRSTNKLALILSSAMKRIFTEGFCKPPPTDTEAPQEQDSKGKEGEKQDGTGMADSEMHGDEKNVSNEIEFEEQITDLMRPDEGHDRDDGDREEDTDKNQKDEDRLEMNADFNAEVEDQPKNEGEDQEEKTPEELEEEQKREEDADDQMGDTGDQGDLQQLDDKWNEDESEDNNENDEDQQEKEAESDVDDSDNQDMPKGEQTKADSSMEAKDDDKEPNESTANDMDVEMTAEDKSKEQQQLTDEDATPEDTTKSEDEETPTADEEAEEGGEDVEDEVHLDDQMQIDAEQDENQSDTADTEDAQVLGEEPEKSDAGDEETKAGEDASDEQDNSREDTPDERRGQAKEMSEGDPSQSQPVQQQQLGKDAEGDSAETTTCAGQSSQLNSNQHPKPTPSQVDQVIERIQRSIHEILANSQNQDTRAAAGESQKQQLLEETDVGNDFAMGAADRHQDLPESMQIDEEEPEDQGETRDDAMIDVDEAVEKSQQSDSIVGDVVSGKEKCKEVSIETMATEATNADRTITWDQLEAETHDLAMDLCEQLRLVLEPTKATKLRGDYRTGKRLNLRKIPAYIASQYRRDKIWLRRSKPSQRTYRIALSIDNSRSMKSGGVDASHLALKSLSTISQALSKLEVGQLAVMAFGHEIKQLHSFDAPWSPDSGRQVLENLTFDEDNTDVLAMLTSINGLFPSDGKGAEWNLNLILSDGICHDHAALRKAVNEGLANRIINVFIILDPSVCEINHVEYRPKSEGGGIKMTNYLDTFPFDFYLVLKDINMLPTVLADTIRQWFEVVANL